MMWQQPDVRYLLLIAGVCVIMATAHAADYRRYVASGGVPTITPWGVQPGMQGVFEIYSFRPDSSYILWRDNEPGHPRDRGSYRVLGNRVILQGGQGELVGTISDDRRSLTIGGNIYEVSGDAPSQPPPPENCRGKCNRMFSDCTISNRPYASCSSQLESCLAACR